MPGRFVTPLVVESLATDERRNARLARPLVFETRDGARLTVPAGFTTDLASIPQALQALIGKWERHAPAAVLHDWLYARQITTRREADWLFASALHAAGVPIWKRAAMWAAVRAGGGRAWKRHVEGRTGMDTTIRGGRLAMARYLQANSCGGPIRPTLIVLHDTAGRLDKGSSVAWFRDRTCTTSAHIVVERDGSVVQMVPLDHKAFHAGESVWRGQRYCNAFSIGIEIVSPGRLDENGYAWFGQAVPLNGEIVPRTTPEHGRGWWLPYTDAQIDAVKRLCRAIMAHYPDVNEIVGHWQIAPGRKIDPSPLLPMAEIAAYAAGETDPETADVPAVPQLGYADGSPATMLQSSTGNTSVMVGGGAGVPQVGMAASDAASRSTTVKEFVVALLAHPMFWTGLLTVAGTVYIWLERRRKLIVHGV